jgi:hypothetical protein
MAKMEIHRQTPDRNFTLLIKIQQDLDEGSRGCPTGGGTSNYEAGDRLCVLHPHLVFFCERSHAPSAATVADPEEKSMATIYK